MAQTPTSKFFILLFISHLLCVTHSHILFVGTKTTCVLYNIAVTVMFLLLCYNKSFLCSFSSPMSYSSTPQQPSPVMSMVKPDQVSHSPTGTHSHQRGPLQGDLRDMISMYIPGGDTTDSGAQRGYSNIQQHYLTGTAPLTHI